MTTFATDVERVAYDRGVAETLALVETVRTIVPALLPPPGQRSTLGNLAERLAGVDHAVLAILKPFDRHEAIALKEAANLAGRSESALREWISRYGIGRTVVGSTMVSQPALLALLDDDALALAAMLAGLRDHPAVLPYLDRAGLIRRAA